MPQNGYSGTGKLEKTLQLLISIQGSTKMEQQTATLTTYADKQYPAVSYES